MKLRSFRVASALAVVTVLWGTDRVGAQGAPSPRVVGVDYVRAKPGELPRLVRFYQLNWARSRRTLQGRGEIVSYHLLVRADTTAGWDIELHTEYPDSAAYDRREEIFRPVMAAQGRTLVDGLDRSALGEIISSRLFVVPPAVP
jgi:hypothetical protein